MKVFSPILPILVLSIASLSAADWLQFRGPNASSLSPETGLPRQLDASHLAWKVSLPGRGVSSPLIVGDRIYLTASSGPEQDRLHLICLRASDGSTVWERQFWATGRTMTHPKICVATCTPCSDGKHLFAAFSSNDVVCVDLEGQLVWMRGLTRDYPNASNSLGMASSPILAGDTLVFPVENDSESFTVGLNVQDGSNRWKIERPKVSNWSSPVVVTPERGQPLVALMSVSGISFVEPATGRERVVFGEGGSTVSSVTAVEGMLFVPSKGTTALRLVSDQEPPAVLWQSPQLIHSTVSPVVLKDRVYALNNAGILKCSAAKDGSRLWQLRTTGPYSATPVGAGDFLYLLNEKGLLQAVDPTAPEGAVASTLDLQDTFIATPSIGAKGLYLRSDKFLYCIKAR